MKARLFSLLLLVSGCAYEPDEPVRYLPIDPRELLYHKGDVVAFEVDSVTTGAAIVTGYLKEAEDSTHIWYDLVFTDYAAQAIPSMTQLRQHRLAGRKVASSVEAAGYLTCVDVEAVRNDCLTDNAARLHVVGQFRLDTLRLQMGSQGACSDYAELVQSFRNSQESRTPPPRSLR